MKKFVFISLLALANINTAFAAEIWFSPVSKSDFPRIEVMPNNHIWLSINSGESSVLNKGCSAPQVRLVPPSGQEDKWLSMILSSFVSGNSIQIYGTCSTNLSSQPVIDGSRFKIVLH